MKIWVLNKIVPLWLFSWYLTFIFHLSPAVSKKIHICLIFPWRQRYLVAYIGEGNKSIELQKLAWKVKLSHKMNESRHNQFIKTKSVKVQFVAKNSKHLVGTSGDDSSALIEFTPLWKTRVSNYPLKLKKKKFDWLFIVDPIWLVWHTYISHSLSDSLTHWPIDPSITYPTRPLRSIFLQKNNSKMTNILCERFSPTWKTSVKLPFVTKN